MIFFGGFMKIYFKKILCLIILLLILSASACGILETSHSPHVLELVGQTKLPALDNYRAIEFINDSDGWAAGDGGIIVHTVDGGITWIQQNSGTTADLTIINFIDNQHGWIAGHGIVLHTNDSGSTWTEVLTGTSTEYISWSKCVSGSGQFMVMGDSGTNKTYHISGDYGVTWETVELPGFPVYTIRGIAVQDNLWL